MNRPDCYNAVYVEPTGRRLRSDDRVSDDNGRSWRSEPMRPNLTVNLPYGYRRVPMTSLLDLHTGRLITVAHALDVPALNPEAEEPRVEQEASYIRYLVSTDGARTWAVDEPMYQKGYTPARPFDRVWIGKNSFSIGDIGDIPIATKSGKILYAFQTTVLGTNGSIWASARSSFVDLDTDVMVFIGTWEGNRLTWDASPRLSIGRERSPRGLMEPTIIEAPDGRILMIMRGGNGRRMDPKFQVPARRWFSVSRDEGKTWSAPEAWTYSDGQSFFSPSSMSVLFKHSSGRIFWAGHISPENCRGNNPRWPLVIGEVDKTNLMLIRDGVLILDTETEQDKARGRLDLYDQNLREDRETKEIVMVYYRGHYRETASTDGSSGQWDREWVTVRLGVK